MNQPDSKKRKFTYFEHRDVFAVLQEMADEETKKQGRVVTVPEIIRESALKRANTFLNKQGKSPIDYDTTAGKFAPGGIGSAVRAVVDLKGRMTVTDRHGNKLPDWKKVDQIPQLLRLYPKCRVNYLTPTPA